MLPLLAFYFCTSGPLCSEIVLIDIYCVSVFSEAVFSLIMNQIINASSWSWLFSSLGERVQVYCNFKVMTSKINHYFVWRYSLPLCTCLSETAVLLTLIAHFFCPKTSKRICIVAKNPKNELKMGLLSIFFLPRIELLLKSVCLSEGGRLQMSSTSFSHAFKVEFWIAHSKIDDRWVL